MIKTREEVLEFARRYEVSGDLPIRASKVTDASEPLIQPGKCLSVQVLFYMKVKDVYGNPSVNTVELATPYIYLPAKHSEVENTIIDTMKRLFVHEFEERVMRDGKQFRDPHKHHHWSAHYAEV